VLGKLSIGFFIFTFKGVTTSDVSVFPKIKYTSPKTEDGTSLLEASKTALMSGNVNLAFELLTEALAVFYQVYGNFLLIFHVIQLFYSFP